MAFVLNLPIAFVLAQLCLWRNADTAARGAAMGALLWFGIVRPMALTRDNYEVRPKELFAIQEFYPLIGFCLMGGILGVRMKAT